MRLCAVLSRMSRLRIVDATATTLARRKKGVRVLPGISAPPHRCSAADRQARGASLFQMTRRQVMRNVLALVWLVLAPGLLIQAQNAVLSPAELSVQQANNAIAKNPQNYGAYNALAMALARRARETSDVAYYAKAEEALQRSFSLKPENFEGLRVRAWLLLGRHEFARALEVARSLNQKIPDDVLVYGFLTDANVELGNYDDAEHAAQWMLDLRPVQRPAGAGADHERERFGHVEGVLQRMLMAEQPTPPDHTGDCAWILTHIAQLRSSVRQLKAADE